MEEKPMTEKDNLTGSISDRDAWDRTSGAATAGKSGAAIDKLKSSASDALGDLKDAAAAVSTDARGYAGGVAADAAGAFKEAVETNKTAGADAIANIAHSVKEAADGIEQKSPQVASIVRSAAEGVERISTDIRDRNVGELVDSVTKFAQRQPAAFFGIGILAGIVLTRFMRNSNS
jgi:methyl-accepting chemotaxis protein